MKEAIVKIAKNDIVVRAAKTFVQATIAVVVAGYADVVSFEDGKALVIAAIAAGVSAAWNAVLARR